MRHTVDPSQRDVELLTYACSRLTLSCQERHNHKATCYSGDEGLRQIAIAAETSLERYLAFMRPRPEAL